MDNIFYQLALVLALSSFIGLIVFKIKLPLVVAYLLSGLILAVLRLFDLGNSPVFEVLPKIGIAFVLFLIGMELKLSELKSLGRPIFIAAVGQIIISTLLGFGIAKLLGFGSAEGIYLGLGLSFSSTVVVVKMLLESRDLSSLFGKLSIGILLVEDLVAIFVLMFISVINSNFDLSLQNGLPLLKIVGLLILTFFLSKHLLNKLFEYTAHSAELLYITSIAWCFSFTALAIFAGFSIEIGAFLAGIALASSPYHLQIQAKIKPTRDFFLALFFIYLGSTADFKDFVSSLPIIAIFTLYALIFKPIIYMFLLGRFGFRKHTLFQTALNLSQVSEFSLIVLMVGVNADLIDPITLSIMAAVAVLSITLSSISISLSKKLYKPLLPLISLLEKPDKSHYLERKNKDKLFEHIVIIGAHRVCGPIINYLQENQIPFIAMDFNPTLVQELVNQGINAIYGDIGNPEIFESLQIESAKLVICTASDVSDNELLLSTAKRVNREIVVVLRATDAETARVFKTLGADYVLLPEKVSGDYIVQQIKHYWPNVHFKDGINLNNSSISTIL